MKPWWTRLLSYSGPYRKEVGLILALMLAGIGANLLLPWPLKLIVDSVFKGEPLPPAAQWLWRLPGARDSGGLLAWLAGGSVALFFLSGGVSALLAYLKIGLGSRMNYALGKDLFRHVQGLSLAFHGRHRVGDITRRITKDCDCARQLVTGVGLPLLSALISLVSMLFIMWRLDSGLALVALFVAIPLGLLMKLTSARMTERSFEQQEMEARIMSMAEQNLGAIPVIQAFGREEYEVHRFRELSKDTVRAQMRTTLSETRFSVGVSAITALGTAVIMGYGGIKVLDGSLTLGTLLVFLSYLASLYAPLESLAYLAASRASALAQARRVFEILDTGETVREKPNGRPLPSARPPVPPRVRFENVTFGYAEGRPVLKDVSLDSVPGGSLALVGPTGAGKSTLISLIPRFFDPWEGRITLDGIDLRELRLAELRSSIALVLQDPFLLPVSVAENIAYGRPDAAPEEILAALKAAQAEELVRRLPRGIHTVIGERGATLSGGEKQRLSIARAFLKNAPILILDEPTSALDAETEALFMAALDRLMENRTTFIIAHRLSTVQKADRILVLDDGRVKETGSPRELMEKEGFYFAYLSRSSGISP